MHIGVDATALVANRTGVGNYVYPILRELCRRHPQVLFSLYSNDRIAFDGFDNVRMRFLSPRRRGPWWQLSHLRQMLAQDTPDVYWGTNGFLPPVGRAVATVLTVHDMVYHFAGQTMPLVSRWGRRWLQPRSIRAADRLIAVSHATAADVFRYCGRQADAVVPPQVADGFGLAGADERARVQRKLNLPQRFYLSLGTLEPRKNIAALVEAYLQQRAAGTALPPLLLAGGGGWMDSEIQAAIAEGERTGAVRRLGFVEPGDLPALYALCEAFLMPSLYEGFGMPLLEAQRCGAAVVHGPHASMREAAGGVGVVCGTDVASLRQLFDELAHGTAALACRTPAACKTGQVDGAAALWEQFQAAAALHGQRGRGLRA